VGFTKPWNPLQPREGSKYLGGHHHSGTRCDWNSRKHQLAGTVTKKSRSQITEWLKA
jgi:hypothetical protein